MESRFWRFYVVEVLRALWLTLPITTIFYLNNFDFSQIGLAESLLAFSVFLLEVPSGFISDKLGHKTIASSGYVVFGSALILIGLSGNVFPLFLFGFLLWGISEALISGAHHSLLYEHIKYLKGDFQKVYLETSLLRSITVIFASLLGAFLYTIEPSLPFLIYGIVSISIAFFLISMKHSERESDVSYHDIRRSLKKDLKRSGVLRVFLIGVVAFFIFQTMNVLILRPLVVESGFSVLDLGWIMALLYGVSWLVPYFFKNKRLSELKIVSLFLPVSIAFIALGFAGGIPFIFLLVVLRVFKDLIEKLAELLLQNRVSSSSRASLLSVQSSLMNLGSSLSLFAFGLIIDVHGLSIAPMVLGVMSLVAFGAMVLTKLLNKHL